MFSSLMKQQQQKQKTTTTFEMKFSNNYLEGPNFLARCCLLRL